MSRYITITLDFRTDEHADMTGAEIRDWYVQRFETMCTYYGADLLVTVSGV